MKRIFVTGTAGFIGFHLARLLLAEGFSVFGYDGLTDYYDVALKRRRHAMLAQSPSFAATEAMLEDDDALQSAIDAFAPDTVVHLAAQAGVRYSLENPHAYISANVVGTMNLMEGARRNGVSHLLMASTSSVYGANTQMPFTETERVTTPLTIYAATKMANEAMAHSYAHLWDLPTTMFRFFTVYGPWGRPDMALFKFTDAILEGRPIDVYGRGQMQRDFTYVDDIVAGVLRAADVVVAGSGAAEVVNLGGGAVHSMNELVATIEAAAGRPLRVERRPPARGDMARTQADLTLARARLGFEAKVDLREGIRRTTAWMRGELEGRP
jgi:UDP-glucuronate 4-epimerase